MRLLILLVLSACLSGSGASVAAQTYDDLARAEAIHDRAEAYFRGTDYEAAIRELRAAYAIFPAPMYLYNIAICYARLGRPRQAIPLLRQFLESPGFEELRYEHAREWLERLEAKLELEGAVAP